VGKPTGFIEHARQPAPHRPIAERVADHLEIDLPLPEEALLQQAARCMDCGIPFCHGVGCPLANRIPEFSDLVYRGRWRDACRVLHATNNFPEITGRACPALCEASCTLNINNDPVLIKHIEVQIAERGFDQGWIVPLPATSKSGKRVAIVGSGPAGLAAAQQLARAGHDVVVFEKDRKVGGLLRYGIPDFKLAKWVVDRRVAQLVAEGVDFQTNVHIGRDLSPKYLENRFDAVCLALGAGQPRDLDVPGRELANVHLAMEFLAQQNRINSGESLEAPAGAQTGVNRDGRPLPEGQARISAGGKIVVVIGGGDTGSDCVGTAIRQGASEVHQLEILPRPPEGRNPQTPWPNWPNILRTSSSHEEGCHRRWSVLTKRLAGEGKVEQLRGVEVQWQRGPVGWETKELPGSEFSMRADLVLLAMGFVHVVHAGLVEQFALDLDKQGNLSAGPDSRTSRAGVFAAGDAASGASLVVRAIAAGRNVAEAIDRWLRESR